MSKVHVTEKLAFQVESFQEGFDILSASPDFTSMVKTFVHILRGNFIIPGISAYHLFDGKGEWITIAGDNAENDEFITRLSPGNTREIRTHNEGAVHVSAIHPLSADSTVIFLFRRRLDGSDFGAMDMITLQILLQIFDSAYRSLLKQKKEKDLIFELNDKISQLNNLIDTVIEISRYDNRHIMYDLILQRISSLTNATAALCRITKPGGQPLLCIFPPGTEEKFIGNHQFTKTCSFKHKEILYEFIIAGKESRKGTSAFNDLDAMLLDAVVRQAQTAIENQYLNIEAIEKEKIEQELAVASSIQKKILPESIPDITGYDTAGIIIPSKSVGGDYYDLIPLTNQRYALIIADVAGKGIGAALLVSTLHAALISYLEFDLAPGIITAKLNTIIYNASPPDKFITFFIAILDAPTGRLDIVNAGHNPLLLLRKDGNMELLKAGGIGLGMFDMGFPFESESVVLGRGDSLFLYTDGIPEAMNDEEDVYSDERLMEFAVNNRNLSSKEFVGKIVEDVQRHSGGAPQSDDITAMLVKRL